MLKRFSSNRRELAAAAKSQGFPLKRTTMIGYQLVRTSGHGLQDENCESKIFGMSSNTRARKSS